MENIEEKACLCALNRHFVYEPKIAVALLEHFGSAREIFSLKEAELDMILGAGTKHRAAIREQHRDKAMAELEALEKDGVRFIGWSERDYPALLKECSDPPVGLYVRSSSLISDLFGQKKSIAIVGTRDITPYGKEWCRRTVMTLASCKEKPVIVSGLAFGTDMTAHSVALEEGLPTIAVMATGPERIYPARNSGLADRIAGTPGCGLVTDYPPGTVPSAIHFLRRNRIIAGLSDALILIESKIRGGGMTTARLAFSYDRPVLALPGRVDDICSQGCNELIRKKIAEPYTSTGRLLESLDMTPLPPPHECVPKAGDDRIGLMSEILLAIKRDRGISVEDIAAGLGVEFKKVAEMTGILESEGLISIDIMRRCTINIKR